MNKRIHILYLIFSFCALLLVSLAGYAQVSLGAPTFTFTKTCATSSYNSFPCKFAVNQAALLGADNQFIIEMSDATGSFATPTTVATFPTPPNTTLFVNTTFSIPANAYGQFYKIRVKSTNPVKTSPGSVAFPAYYGVHDQPFSINNNIEDVNICSGTNYSLSIDNTGTPASPLFYPQLTYVWYKDFVEIPGQTGPTLNITASGSYFARTYYGACTPDITSYSNTVTVTIQEILTPQITTNDNSNQLCPASTKTLTCDQQGSNFVYSWYRDNVVIPGATLPTYVASQAGTYHLRMTGGGCIFETNDIYLELVDFNLDPDPATSSVIAPGQSVTLTGINDAANPTYQWFKNGVAISGANQMTYNATQPDTYKVAVTEPAPCNITKEVNFTVTQPDSFNIAIQTSAGYQSCVSTAATLSIAQFNAVKGAVSTSILGNNYGYAYQWYKDNVAVAGATSTSLVVNNALNNGSYTLKVTIPGFPVITSNAVVVNIAVANVIVSGPTSICQGAIAALTSSINNSGYTYQWFKNGIAVPGITTPTFAADTAGDYYVKVSIGSCSAQSNTIHVTIVAITVSSTNAATDIIFPGQTKTLTVTTTAQGAQYIWYRNNVVISGATAATYTATQNGTYKVVVTQTIGCTATAETTFTLNYPSGFTIAIAANAGYTSCASTTATLAMTSFTAQTPSGDVNVAGMGYSYQWYKNNVAVPGATSATLLVNNSSQNGVYKLVATVPSFPPVTSGNVTVNLAMENITIAGNTNLCAGSTVNLTASVNSAAYTYQWYKNGTIITGQTLATLTVNAAGSYYVKVTGGACSTQSNALNVQVVTVNSSVSVPAVDIIFPGQTKTITATTNAASPTYVWYRNSVVISGATSGTYTATQDGTYKVVVTQTVGCPATAETTFTLNYPSGFTIAIAANAGYASCASTTATLTMTSFLAQTPSGNVNVAGMGYTYQWYKNNVAVPGATSGTLVINNASENGIYKLVATVPSFPPVTSANVTVNLAIESITISGNTNMCAGSTVNLSASVNNAGYSYQWYKNGVAITGETTAALTVNAAGSYYVKVTGGACVTQSNTLVVQVVTVNVTGNVPTVDIIFPGQTKTITVTTNAASPAYVWYKDNVVISGATSATYVATEDGVYKVVITQTVGCPATAESTFTLNYPSAFTLAIAADAGYLSCDSTIASLSMSSFTATIPTGTVDASTLGYQYQWYRNNIAVPGATSAPLIVSSASQNGIYRLEATVPDFGTIVSNNVTINLAIESIVITNAAALCEGSSVAVTANVNDAGYSYQWYKNGTAITGETAPALTVTADGDYYLIVSGGICTEQSNTVHLQAASINVNTTNAALDVILPGQNKTLSVTTDAIAPAYAWYRNNVLLATTTPTLSATQEGTYRVVVTQTTGCPATEEKTFTLEYPTGFVITVAANTAYTACISNTATLTVTGIMAITPSGNIDASAMAYPLQWYNGTTAVTGATGTTLALNNPTQNGAYQVVATIPDFSPVSSNTVMINLTLPMGTVVISSSGALCEGGTVIVSSTVTDGAYTYQWYKDGVTLAGANAPALTAGSIGNYYLVITAGTCTSQSNTVNLQNATITVNSTAPATDLILPGQTKTITVTTDAVVPTYTWYRNNVAIAETSATLTATQQGVYKVVVTETSGCTITAEKTFTLQYPTGFNLSIAANTGYTPCAVTPVTLSIASFTATTLNGTVDVSALGYQYQWYKDNMPLTGATGATLLLNSAAQSGSYTLVATIPDFGVVTSNNITVNIAIPAGSIAITQSGDLCDGGTATLMSGTTDSSYTYQWYKNGSPLANANASTFEVNSAGDYYVIITSGTCTSQSNILTIAVVAITVTSTNPSVDVILPGGTKALTVTTSAASPTYVWYRNNVQLTETSATLTATQDGEYKVVVTQTTGCNAVEEKTFTLNYPTGFQIVVVTDLSYSACTSDTVTLNVSSFVALAPSGSINVTGAGYQYQWYKDNVAISGATGATYTIPDQSQNGVYKVEAIIPGFSGIFSNNITVNLGVGTVTLTSAGVLCDENSQVVFSSNITDASFTYTWYNGAMQVSSGNNPQYAANEPGDYSVKVVNGTCITTSNTITIQQSSFNLTADGPVTGVIIPGDTKVLSVTTDALQPTYVWTRNDIVLAGETSSSITVTLAGEYKVVVTQNQDCVMSKYVVFGFSNPSGFALTIGTQGYESCVSTEANLFITDFKAVTSEGIIDVIGNDFGYGYQWYKDGAIISGATAVTYTALQTGIYSLEVNIPGFGIVTSNGIAVEIAFAASITITKDGIFCADGTPVTLSSDITNPDYQYRWYHNNTVITGENEPAITVTEVGDYYLSITYNGCTLMSNVLSLEPYDMDQVQISVGPAVDLPEGTSIIVTAEGAESYTWYKDGEKISEEDNIKVEEGGTYTMVGKAGDCEVTREFIVTIVENTVIAIPNIITPNNDGVNDTWALPLKYLNDKTEVVIYSPTGAIVFRASHYNNNWPESDFTWSRKDPVYYFTIMEDNVITKRGSITIVK